jgi:hypothetical protein
MLACGQESKHGQRSDCRVTVAERNRLPTVQLHLGLVAVLAERPLDDEIAFAGETLELELDIGLLCAVLEELAQVVGPAEDLTGRTP